MKETESSKPTKPSQPKGMFRHEPPEWEAYALLVCVLGVVISALVFLPGDLSDQVGRAEKPDDVAFHVNLFYFSVCGGVLLLSTWYNRYLSRMAVFLRELRVHEQLNEIRLLEKAQDQENEDLRIKLRDADTQSIPYTYDIGRHANETLAIRYGIANCRFGRGEKNHVALSDLTTIKVRKLRKIRPLFYHAELPEYGNRKVSVLIEPGTEYVQTFYPMNEKDWFAKHGELEAVLKGNRLYSISDLARIHVEKAF